MSPHFAPNFRNVTVALEDRSPNQTVALRSRRLPRVPSCAGGILPAFGALRLSALYVHGLRRFASARFRGFDVLLRPGSEDLIVVSFTSLRANLPRKPCAGGILRLWAIYEHVLRRLLRPHSREGESARGVGASSALTG